MFRKIVGMVRGFFNGDPSEVRVEVQNMQARANVCNALMGGTEAMRSAKQEYLPQWPRETKAGWESRLACTVLYPAYKNALESMVGKPLGKNITFEDVPESITLALEDADLQGRDLDTFAREWFKQSLVDGLGWVLVEYPIVPQGITLADERTLNARPYLVHIPLSQVCGWKTEIVGGNHKLTQFRWRETFEVPDGHFSVKTIERIKVWEPGEVAVYIQDGGSWTLDPERSGKVSLKEMPFVCFAPGRTGFYTAEPPLSELAWLNVQHWQSSSDQRNILHIARVPVLAADSVPLDQKTGEPIVVGSNDLIVGAVNLHFVEHTGAAIGAGRQDLLDLQEQMSLVAGRILNTQTTGNISATQSSLEAKDSGAKLLYWASAFQDCIEEIIRLMGAWTGQTHNGSAKLSMDWDDTLDPLALQTALQARQCGELSRDSWLYIAQRYRILRPDATIEEEKAAIEAEGPVDFGKEV